MWAGEQIKEKYQNGCHLKTIGQNNQKSNQRIVGINVNIHTKYEVSMTIYMGRRANQREVSKNLPFKNYGSEELNIQCAYLEHKCIFLSNMKFLSLILWLGGLCTDDANDLSIAMITQASLILYQMSQKLHIKLILCIQNNLWK